MRLTTQQVTAIKQITAECFGDGALVYLFGSRLDDKHRGGDIDLYIETEQDDAAKVLEAKYNFLAKLKQRIGDQRIDIVVSYPARRRLPSIIAIAKRTGVRL
jgi:predicted nucleotidyltransferase